MTTLDRWIEALTGALLHSLWQGCVVAIVLAGILACCPRSRPEWRYRAGMMALLVLGLWMVLTIFQGFPDLGNGLGRATGQARVAGEEMAAVAGPEAMEAKSNGLLGWRMALVSVWMCGAGFFLVRLSVGGFGLATLRRHSSAVVDFEHLRLFEGVKSRIGIRQGVALRLSDVVDSPLTFGFLRPVVLIPTSLLTAMPTPHLEAIFAHELMHVLRADYLFNVALSIVRSLLFYHPAVWWMAKCIRVEREMSCDLGSVESLRSSASAYAKALLALEDWRGSDRHRESLAMSMVAGNGLLARVERLALARQRGAISSPVDVPLLMIFALVSISVFAGWQLAEDGGANREVGSIERVMTDLPAFVVPGEIAFGVPRDIAIALTLLKHPGQWPIPNSEGRLMRSPLVIDVNGIAHPFGVNDPAVFGGIANAWILKHGLDYRTAGVAERDLDRDGFSNSEEFAADTIPTDASSHPPLIDKLRFVERKQQLYRIRFAAQPDGETFQLNRLPSVRWVRRTMMAAVGETTADGQLAINEWDGVQLSVQFLPTRKIYRINKGEELDMPIDFAGMLLDIGDRETYTVRVGDEFALGDDGGLWTLDSVDQKAAVLRNSASGEKVKIFASNRREIGSG